MIVGYDGSRAFINNRTGTENYSYQLLKALAKIDHKNSYVVYLSPSSLQGVPLEVRNKNFQFKVIRWPRLWTQVGLAKQTFKDKLDVLFVPAHTLPVIRKPGLRTVVTVHDLGSQYLPKMHQVKQRLYLSFMQKFQLKGATKIIAVSKATKTDLISKIGIDGRKIKVVYEGFDNKLFRPIKGDVLRDTLRSLDLVPGEYFLFVGTVQPRKNLERLIVAYHKFISGLNRSNGQVSSMKYRVYRETQKSNNSPYTPYSIHYTEPKLVIVGSKGWLSDEIYALPKKLGIEKSVKFLGRVEDKDLPVLYSGAIALTFPSLYEGFGLPIIEAQACGCPVITSNISSMPEVAGKSAILVNPYDIESISKGMIRVKSQESRVKLMKAGFKNIKRFSWEKCAKETIKVFEKVVK